MKKVNLAIVGATGMVGNTFLQVLEDRDFPFENLYLFSSAKSAGSKLTVKGKEYTVEELTENSFDKDIDIALFSAGGTISEKFAPIARDKGIIVVDNSSAWRMEKDIPLVIPEVNPEAIETVIKERKGIIANPNCSTIQSIVPLKPLHDAFKLKRIIYSTYQAVSGSGVKGVADLENGTTDNYPYPISYNCLPHIDSFLENGYTKEEIKMIDETKKILNDYDLKITATTVRVPVKNGHAVSINLEFEKPFELSEVFELLKNAPGIVVQDDPANLVYPMQIEVSGKDEVYVGRIRRDFSVENGLNLWVVADNIRKGAATNTIQIAELLAKSL
ncbi:aspartate-semialdehyde dehydrogenase Asd [Gottschalkia acidurici 9a]|uniref:Aspartate-semialdehyde dehydrogenase n=1 Tax=Gottschalkia acidurici (strain ATCC 7906 / DSM 604 / BCRC 14475 / CIP 104303 / KCTC 5404 / NCIMB 10678 / 9a) TaxID=1128398 RepID=K0AWI4_GOTA9|nr:aspartate-semialdehyde dehydrogenase [Gottschalkia acidurici]AFS78193.1 aspartate-semialdehyde dehydrogenase Asd [Gottschalkia acidurici 9a]